MTPREKIWDPLRRREVALTPEERVRQWFIGVLRDSLGVPEHMMMSEASFKLSDKRLRADIVIWDRSARPVAIVECKRPDVVLGPETIAQTARYNLVLDVRFIFITNGVNTFIARRDGNSFTFVPTAPTFNEMLSL